VILVSFGTVAKTDPKRGAIMARVLAQFPQRVLWRHTGATPAGLGNNTLRLDWLPQQELLQSGHVRLFITHCGISGTYQAAHYGVPVVTMPLFWDQDRNSAKLVERWQMGVMVDYYTMTEDVLHQAISEVLQNSTYQQNAKTVQNLINDQLVDPKKKFLFWVEYIIQNNGATHLISKPAYTLNIFQYFLLDVLIVILLVVTCTIAALIYMFKTVLRLFV